MYMVGRIQSVPTLDSVQDVDYWQQDLRYAVESFKREVPTIEDCLPDLRQLEAICLQNWQGPNPEQRVMGDFRNCIYEVCKLWDKIQKALYEMEQREPDLEIRHLLRDRQMYPYTARAYDSSVVWNSMKLHVLGCWRRDMANLGTWVFGTSPESRRLTRQAALLHYRAGLLKDECAVQAKIQRENQQVLESLAQVQTSLQRFDQAAVVVVDRVGQAVGQVVQIVQAPVQRVSIEFFKTLEQDLRRYCDQPKAQLDQLREFEQQIMKEEAEVAALLRREQQLDAQLNELEEHHLKAATEMQGTLQNQMVLAQQVGDKAVAIARTPKKPQGSRHERPTVVVVES